MRNAAFAVFFILVFSTLSYPSEFNACFLSASKYYNIPVRMLKALAKTESGNHIYAINIRGKSYYPANAADAYNLIKKSENKSPDIGIMQINISWFKRYGYPLSYALNPCFNIYFGAYILRKKVGKYGYNWKGIAAYHSATPKKNRKYAWMVYWNLIETE